MKRKLLTLTLLLALLTTLLVGCSSGTAMNDADTMNSMGYNRVDQDVKSEVAMDGDWDLSYAEMESTPAQGIYTESAKPDSVKNTTGNQQKLIKTVHLSSETEDMDKLLAELNGQTEALGGYVENREINNGSAYSPRRSRWASLVLRVPVERLGELVSVVENASNVTSYTETVDDVTLQYVDTASRREALETEYDRLQELLEKADNMADLLTIESRMTEVRYQLESVVSQLRVYDNKVNYATVYLNISEVTKLTPGAERTRWQQIGDGFVESIQNVCDGFLNFCVWLLANSPYLLIVAAAVVVLVLLLRRSRKKRREKAARNREQNQEPGQTRGPESGTNP